MSVTLQQIHDKLSEVVSGGIVCYGMVDKAQVTGTWDYIVFGRSTMSASANKTGYSDYYTVAIVRENFIPQGLELTVIDKMLELDGVRLSNKDGQYSYTLKPSTNTVVELLELEFVIPKKRV